MCATLIADTDRRYSHRTYQIIGTAQEQEAQRISYHTIKPGERRSMAVRKQGVTDTVSLRTHS